MQMMKEKSAFWIPILALLAFAPAALAQDNAQAPQSGDQQAAASPNTDTQKNTEEYIDLLRSDVQQQKAEIMGSVMQLSAADAAKFWPIYSEYNTELTKLNDLRLANIQEYARTYDQMTDEKADELMQKAMAYRKQRSELVAKYYDRVKQQLGAITAARFVQVEDQLLLIIDLQIDSSLPIVEQGS
jgi:hypothetical protein